NLHVLGVTPGEATTVRLTLSAPLPGDPTDWTYWRYGPTPRNGIAHWYQWLYQRRTDSDDASTTGAEFVDSTHIVLHLVDGGRGDNDLHADGVITDPGGPGVAPAPVATLEPDPLSPGKAPLAVTGTPGNDLIRLVPTDAAGDLDVLVNGRFLGNFLPTGHILVDSRNGNDTVRLEARSGSHPASRVRVPAIVMAGNGNAVLIASGSDADNVLVAGTGRSRLVAGTGRDILVGSPRSTFQTGRGDDLVIRGVTAFNGDIAALGALRAEWSGGGPDDAARIDHLLHGGGLNGTTVLSDAVLAPRPAHNTLLATPLELARPILAGPSGVQPVTATAPTFRWYPEAETHPCPRSAHT